MPFATHIQTWPNLYPPPQQGYHKIIESLNKCNLFGDVLEITDLFLHHYQ